MSRDKIELEIIALSHSASQNHSYAVMLGEKNGVRRMPIIIGGSEAQAIAVAMERMLPTRPLSHDLMKNMMVAYGIELEEVYIRKLSDGVFYSTLYCSNSSGKIEIDSRTSDALALAARFDCPIYTNEEVITNAGILLEEGPIIDQSSGSSSSSSKLDSNSLSNYTIAELNNQLNDALDNEDYILAASLRDELNSRKK
jgi:uncharacterized protein